ncbi:MAG: DivIVA domain-containing protein [Carbonactinosporaceae bacterium]
MFLFQLLVVAGVIFVIAAVAAGYGDAMPGVRSDRRVLVLPASPLGKVDVDRLRLDVGFRGYRMDEVDDVLDRLAAELADRDSRIARLERDLLEARTAQPPHGSQAGACGGEA